MLDYMFINVADKLAKKILGETWQESIDIKQHDTLQMMFMRIYYSMLKYSQTERWSKRNTNL